MSRRPAVYLLACLALLASACGGEPAPPPRPAPSPTGIVATIESPSALVLRDGRRIHVARMNGLDPTDACDERADRALAERLIGGGQTITLARARSNDAPSKVPAGYAQADVRTPSQADYADTFFAQAPTAREKACPTPTPTSTPTGSSGSSGDVEVDVDRDDDGESRFCRGRWWC